MHYISTLLDFKGDDCYYKQHFPFLSRKEFAEIDAKPDGSSTGEDP